MSSDRSPESQHLCLETPYFIMLKGRYSPRASGRYNQVVEAKRFESVFICRKEC